VENVSQISITIYGPFAIVLLLIINVNLLATSVQFIVEGIDYCF